jgi:hypothetical protein
MSDLDVLSPPPTITLPFSPDSFPDARLFARAQTSAESLLASWPTGTRPERASRRGLQRLVRNPRIDARRLLADSAEVAPLAAFPGDVVLIAEDTSLVRAGGATTPADAGPLRSARDRGYLLHAAVAADPATGRPFAWLGADVWTRTGPLRGQDHKARPPSRKESRKWAQRRRKVVALLRERVDSPHCYVHLTDREGDCWASLLAAWREGTALVTRVAQQHRAIVEHPGGLRAYLRTRPVAETLTLALRQTVRGARVEREATVLVRWAAVTLRPPYTARGRARRELPMFAVWLHERSDRGASVPVDVMLLTTLALQTTADAVRAARWYTARWSVEIVFDLIKNACRLEAHAVTDVASFERLVAISGPVATQVASWIQQARSPRPPPVRAVFDPATLRALRTVCRHYRVPTPPRWSVATAVRALACVGGWEPRNDRQPGWRVVARGWARLEELRAFADFLRDHPEDEGPPPSRESPRKRGPP